MSAATATPAGASGQPAGGGGGPVGDRDLAALLYGRDPLPGIVAVEPAGANGVLLYRRPSPEGPTVAEPAEYRPWLIAGDAALATALAVVPAGGFQEEALAGDGALNRLLLFSGRPLQARALSACREAGVPHFGYTSPVTQYLTLAGRTLFHGLRFEDLHRVQIDVETTSLRPTAPDASILLVAVTSSRGHEETIRADEGGEARLLERLTRRLRELDPDVIEGHNLVDFDIPYLAARAGRHGVPLSWGRDGSAVWLQEREGRYKVGARILPSMRVHVHGRHVVDTFQQIQRYDTGFRLESYGLKPAVEALELQRPGREFVDRERIADVWREDPARLARYCLDDARDVRSLADLITPTEFYQTQIVPRSYGDVATGGTGEKINALLVRAYVDARRALPEPEAPRPYPGGYSELRAAGVFRRVVKGDVESLYPAVMLHFGLKPAADSLDVFLPLLADLTRRRLDAKGHLRRTRGAEYAYWNGLSSSYKVLINCFTPGHQVLTPGGFRLVEDLRVGDTVFSLNPGSGAVEQKAVTHTWEYDYDGEVIQYRHQNVDFEVTPNHQFLLEDFKGRRLFRPAEELPQLANHSLPPIPPLVPPDADTPPAFDLTDFVSKATVGPDGRLRLRPKTQGAPRWVAAEDMMRLIGWYVTEGHLRESVPRQYATTVRGLTRRVTLYQRLDVNPEYHREICVLAEALGMRYYASVQGVSFSSDVLYRFLSQECGRGSASKRLPAWVFALPLPLLELLWDTLMKGDGDKGYPRFTTKSPQLKEDFARLCYLIGRRVSVAFDGCYRIIVKRERRVSLRRRPDHFVTRHHRGKVYCVTVADNHTLLAGRDYKLNWIGQSFYGFLGYSRGVFNDFSVAEEVTTTGQRLIKAVLAALEEAGCEIIEVDTDGVYFVPPEAVQTEAQELALVERIGRVLPQGINLAHDGRYAGMVALKQKTYFVLTYDGKLQATGSSLRSRRDELYLRRFVQGAAVTLVEGSLDEVSEAYKALARRIQAGELRVEDYARRESITGKTHTSPGLRRLAAAARGVPVGQQVQVYQRRDGSLALTSEYQGDEDRDYLLRRLHDMARRFEGLVPGGAKGLDFKRLFPFLQGNQAPPEEHHVQLSLFE